MKNYIWIFFLPAVFYHFVLSMPQKNALFRDRSQFPKSSDNRYLKGEEPINNDREENGNEYSNDTPNENHDHSLNTTHDHEYNHASDIIYNHQNNETTPDSKDHYPYDTSHIHSSEPSHSDSISKYRSDPNVRDWDHSEGVVKEPSEDSIPSNTFGANENEPVFNYPQIPIPKSYDDVSDMLNGAVSKFEHLPGVNLITDKNGIFGDTFSNYDAPDSKLEDGIGNHETGQNDYITGRNPGGELPPNVEQLLQLDFGDETTLDQSYISISADLKVYQNTYLECLEALSDLDFNQRNIERCVGKGQRFIEDDISFFKRKILAKADSIIQARFFDDCYKPAGSNLVLSSGCDLLQKDIIKLLWDELNYYALIDYHRNKYIFEHANLPSELVDEILTELKFLYAKQDSLLVELYNHSILTHQRIKDYLADRTLDLEEDINKYGPLERGTLPDLNIIQVDSVKSKLHKLNQIRDNQPWVMNKANRKTKGVGGGIDFKSPWGKGQEKEYGRYEIKTIANAQKNLVEEIDKHMESS